MSKRVDILQFKSAFPQWKDCDDTVLDFWVDLSECIICLPANIKGFDKLPYLMLAHMLSVNGIRCAPVDTASPDACQCDDEFLVDLLGKGVRLSSATMNDMSVSFNNVGVNGLVSTIAKSPFSAWLAMTQYGTIIAALLPRLMAGPTMAFSGGVGRSHYGDDVLLPHLRIPGHG